MRLWGCCHPTHQSVGWFPKDHLHVISWFHCKYKTEACVSKNINKSFECVTITDSKSPDGVLRRTTPKCTPIYLVTSTTWIIEFLPQWVKIRTFVLITYYQLHFSSWIVFDILSITTVLIKDMTSVPKLVHIIKLIVREPSMVHADIFMWTSIWVTYIQEILYRNSSGNK